MLRGSITRHKPAPKRRKNILWLDDNIEKFSGQIARLSINGHQVFCCKTVSEYLFLIENYFIDVSIIDLKLSGSDSGRDIVNFTNKNHPLTRVLIYSNFIDENCDFKPDNRGNLHLSVNRKELLLLHDHKTRLDKAVETLMTNSAVTTKKMESKRWFQGIASWRVNSEAAKFSLGRIIPILAIINFASRYSAVFDPKMTLVKSLLNDHFLIFAFFMLIVVVVMNWLFCPDELRKEPRYSRFMTHRLKPYQNDEVFARSVNNTLEKARFAYLEHKPFNRLKQYYEIENFSRPIARILQFSAFVIALLAVIASLVGTLSKLEIF